MSKHERTLARYPVQPHLSEHQAMLDRITELRGRLRDIRSGDFFSDDYVPSLELEAERRRLAEEADKAVRLAFLSKMRERREKAKRVNYFVAVDDVAISSKILRRPSANNQDFTDVHIPKGEVLFHQGQLADSVFLIDEGQIEIFTHVRSTEDSEQQVELSIAKLGNEAMFGEQAILYGGRRGASARATRDTVCLEVSGDRWREMLGKQSGHVKTGFRSLMLEQIQINMVNEALRTAEKGDEISLPELYLYDPLAPLELPEEHRDQMHLHSLFSELVWEAPSEKKVISTSAGLYQILKGLQAFVVTHGEVEFSKGGVTFLGGPGTILGAAHSIAGEKANWNARLPDGTSQVEVLVISGDQAFAEIRRLESAIVRFTRAICMRCLGVKKRPKGLT